MFTNSEKSLALDVCTSTFHPQNSAITNAPIRKYILHEEGADPGGYFHIKKLGGGLGPGLKFSGKMWGNVTKQEENAFGLPTQ